MSENDKNNDNIFGKKQGIPIYISNPSIEHAVKAKHKKISTGEEREALVIHPETHEIIGHKDGIFYQWKEVDSTQFVKVYLEGIKNAVGLSKTGLILFEVVYNILKDKKNQDGINLSHYIASQHIKDLNDRTYRRGLRELLEKEFLFRSPTESLFFVNIHYMFNGDRLAFVRGYWRKKENEKK